jgi:hypothetical protein
MIYGIKNLILLVFETVNYFLVSFLRFLVEGTLNQYVDLSRGSKSV